MTDSATVKFNMDNLNSLIKSLKQDYFVRVGIIGAKAKKEHEGGLTNAELGSVHEFGTDIKVPAHTITNYKSVSLDKNGNFRNWKYKGRFRKRKLKSTNWAETFHVDEYNINIPARSFLEIPLKDKLKYDNDSWQKIKKSAYKSIFVKKKPKEFFSYLAGKALEIVQGAFDSNGYGQWMPLAASTKRQKAKKGSPHTLIGRGRMKNSIMAKVMKHD